MRFDLDPELKQALAALDRLLGDELTLEALASDEKRAAAQAARSLRSFGVCDLMLPPEAGGAGMGLLGLAAVTERLAYFAAPSIVAANALAASLLVAHGASAVSTLSCAAEGAGERQWRLVEAADTAGGILCVAADSLILLDRDTYEADPTLTLDVSRQWFTVRAHDAGVRLGDAVAARRMMDAARVLAAADAFGAGSRALALAVDYAKTRHQFGKPIGAFQGLKHQLADAATALEPARFLVWRAAYAWDRNEEGAPRLAALAHAHCGEVAVSVARLAVEAHGALGFTWSYPLHLFLKRAMHARAILGGSLATRERAAKLAEW